MKTQPVAQKKLRHARHVWQWVAEPFHDIYDGAQTDGSVWGQGADASLRVTRGASKGYSPRNLRSAVRVGSSYRDNGLGFRVARTHTPCDLARARVLSGNSHRVPERTAHGSNSMKADSPAGTPCASSGHSPL